MGIRILVWNEFVHEKQEPEIAAVYPEGIHRVLAAAFGEHPALAGATVRTATLADPDCGLTDAVLRETDVLVWWGHVAHHLVPDETARLVADHVLRGLGLVVLHSGHFSKPFKLLMGTSCTLKWRDGDRERLWTASPGHPILRGVPEHFELLVEEMYGEPFDIPTPDETLLIGWFAGGEVFRSACLFRRGLGQVFYFQPGHEANPTFYDANVRRILGNAVSFVAPARRSDSLDCLNVEALEKR